MARLGGKDRGIVEKPKGSGRWFVRLWDRGREHHFGVFTTKTSAKAFYSKAKEQQRERRFDPGAYHRRQIGIRLSEVVQDYLAVCTLKSKRDMKRRGKWWEKVLKNRPMDQITTRELERIQAQMVKKKSPATVNRYFAALKRFYSIAVRDGGVKTNPVKGVKFFKEPQGRLRFLSNLEEEGLRKIMLPGDFAAVAIALHTGLRQSEQFDLRWDCVNLSQAILTVPRSKSGETRHVPLNSKALTVLRGLNSWMVSAYVFPSKRPSSPMSGLNFYKRVFKPAIVAAKLEGVVWHTLRHTFASRLAMAGIDIRTIQELLGHKEIKMTLRYSHLSPGHLKAAVETLTGTGTKTGKEKALAESDDL